MSNRALCGGVLPSLTSLKGNAMKTYIVYAERVVQEVLEVEANSEQEALEKAMEADNSEWQSETDVDWEIKSAKEVV
jgi:hypothetical protein